MNYLCSVPKKWGRLQKGEGYIIIMDLKMVKLEDDKVVLFRYYDPRVLRKLLPDYNETELDTFFSDSIQSFMAESEDPEVVNIYRKEVQNGKTILSMSNYKINTI